MIMRPKHILLCVCACVCACACTRTVYLPTETVRNEYRADTRVIRDTLRTSDTVTIDRAADTIRIDRTHWRTRTIHATDTIIRATTDTLRVSVSVPRELTAAQRRWIGLGKIAAALLAVAAAIAAVWLYRRIRRRS